MVVEIGLCYGLGNQMYNYAFAKALEHYYKQEVCIDISRHNISMVKRSAEAIALMNTQNDSDVTTRERERERDSRTREL